MVRLPQKDLQGLVWLKVWAKRGSRWRERNRMTKEGVIVRSASFGNGNRVSLKRGLRYECDERH